MNKIKAVLIDDENDSIEVMQMLLAKHCPTVEVVAWANSVDDGLKIINEYNPHLVFLDVEMPGKNGFEVLKEITNPSFHVIMVTGYENYAIKAIKHSAIDYLLKPVAEEDFTQAVNKAIELKGNELSARKLELMLSNMTKNEFSKIAIPSIDSFEFIDKKDILYCEADVSYTTIYLENKKIVSTNNIKKLESILTETNFFRLHKSFIVNIDKIQKVLKTDGGSVVMPNDIQIPIARRRKDEFMQIIGL